MMFKRMAIFGLLAIFVGLMGGQALAADKEKWPKAVTQGSGPVGGTFFSLCGGWVKAMEKLGIQVTCRVTGAAVANTKLMQSGSIDFAIGALSALYEGYKGEGWAKGTKHDRIRGMFVVYPHYAQLQSLVKSGITKTADLAGKRVHLGATGGMNYVLGLRYLERAGVKPAKVVTGNWADANNLFRDGLVDAIFNYASAPHPSVNEAVNTFEAQLIDLDKPAVEKMIKDFPYLNLQNIPAKAYGEKPDKPVYSFGDWVAYFTHKDMPDDFVYQVVKATFENKDSMVAAASAAKKLQPENISYLSIPIHKGALKFYKEKGIAIPKIAVPVD